MRPQVVKFLIRSTNQLTYTSLRTSIKTRTPITTRISHPVAAEHSFSTTAKMSTPITATALFDLIKSRRTYYALNKDLGSVTPAKIQEIVTEAVKHVPTSFNSQTNRTVILFGAEHDKLWDMATAILKEIVPADKWESTAGRMAMFKGAAGTVLCFEDQEPVKALQEKLPMYAERFPGWATQSDGMMQHIIWTALEAEGLGANLQHYNPLIDQKIYETWGVPVSWKLNAQLVFGGRSAEPGAKEFGNIEERVKVFGA